MPAPLSIQVLGSVTTLGRLCRFFQGRCRSATFTRIPAGANSLVAGHIYTAGARLVRVARCRESRSTFRMP